jgi:hypothetical protein
VAIQPAASVVGWVVSVAHVWLAALLGACQVGCQDGLGSLQVMGVLLYAPNTILLAPKCGG